MASSSHNICPSSRTLSSSDKTWNSTVPNVPWVETPSYSPPGMRASQQWMHGPSHSNSNQAITPIPGSPCSNTTVAPPSPYHMNHIPWPVGSSTGYILPNTHNAPCHPNVPWSTPMTPISSLNTLTEEIPDTVPGENRYDQATGAHTQHLEPGFDANHCGRYKCRWQGCKYNGVFSRQTCLWRHIRSTHVSPDEFKCPARDCNETFGRKDKLQSHMRLYHITHGQSEQCTCRS